MSTTHTTTFRNAVCTTIINATPSGKLVYRASPSTANAPGAEVASLALSATSFGAPASGAITANAIADDTSPVGGTVAYATIESSAGVVQAHCQVAASGSDIDFTGGLVVAPTDIVSCSSLVYTAMP